MGEQGVEELRKQIRDLKRRLEESERRFHQVVGTAERARLSRGEAAAILDGIVSALHEAAIVAIDRDGRYVFVWIDPVLEERYGICVEALLGKSIHEILPPDMAAERIEITRRAMETGERYRDLYPLTTPKGTFWHDASIAPLRDAEGQVTAFVGIVLDVTERKRAEDERERFRERLREAEKQDSLGQLAAGAAHDFNNLLMSIQGNASQLRDELAPGSEALLRVELIERASAHAADMIQKLLTFAGSGALDMRELALGELCEDVAAIVRGSLPAGVELRVDLDPQLPSLRADATRLRQVLLNLLANAVEASRETGGTVHLLVEPIRADRALLDDAKLGEHLPAGDYIGVRVRDQGAGMDAETLRRAFDPFFTTKPGERGLGLPTVLGIVRRHRGAIQVASRPGQGSEFLLLLPRMG
ncbi:MAG: PAS domain-containing protein [Deltaproteobacteria bacterium]|nr:PAS domain-containing protein [Deltaproteobacteria bacterium]